VLGKPVNLFLREVSNRRKRTGAPGPPGSEGSSSERCRRLQFLASKVSGEAERDRILQALKEANGLIGGPTGAAA
jgi:hypothetical protein